ncbi:IS5 family transposase [Candidatus Bandiella woodruffii]|uniref:IS5 family transposase n=1 Tax=Candidatus Bandiella euplotis TaxID=1664265 RepID=A0ABZ0ULV6_9RICK|nr:IS5 family transposase [Candidatus Bandiella woodruffii]
MLYNNTARAFISGEQPLNLVFVKLHPHSLHLYLCIPLILPFLTYLLLLHFLHSVFIFLFSLLLAIFILASYLSYGNTPKDFADGETKGYGRLYWRYL